MHLYIYYDVPLANVPEVEGRAHAMLPALESACRRVRLQKRTTATSHAETWMEVYEDVIDGFEALLAVVVERSGLGALTSERHVERFVDID